MRIKIALCDDDRKALPIISGAAESTFQEHGIQTDIYRFTNARSLLRSMEQNRYHLLLLDIDMPEMDGISLAKRIRAGKDDIKIVFVSETESRVFESFMVQPLGFVRKSNFLNDISAVVDLYIKTIKQENTGDYLNFTTRTGILALKSHQITYIECIRNVQMVNVDGREDPLEVKMTMDKLEKMTEPFGFIRIHKGFLVNYQYIQHLSSTTAVLQNGVELPIGRSKLNEVKMKYLKLIGR